MRGKKRKYQKDSEYLVVCVCVYMHEVGRGTGIVREKK